MKFVLDTMLRIRMEELLSQSHEIDVAVAWIGASPALFSMLNAARHSKTKLRIVTGVGGYLTDPALLRKIAPIAELKIYGEPEGQLYHPKLYIFRNGHLRTVWVGSANLTRSALDRNVESVLEFNDAYGSSIREFDRFWVSKLAVRFDKWDVDSYEVKRKAVMNSLKGSPGRSLLPDEVVETPDFDFDILKSGWSSYVAELQSVGKKGHHTFNVNEWLFVLEHRNDLIERDWTQDLTDSDLAIMYGKQDFAPFGRLNAMHQSKFLGRAGKKNRKLLGEFLQEAAAMKSFQEPLIQKIFENLCNLDGCGPALASRLLVLARPDVFVVVNKKSFQGLAERFQIPVPRSINPKRYAELLRKIHEQPWCRNPQPSDAKEKTLWQNRTALVDPLVYRENPDSLDD